MGSAEKRAADVNPWTEPICGTLCSAAETLNKKLLCYFRLAGAFQMINFSQAVWTDFVSTVFWTPRSCGCKPSPTSLPIHHRAGQLVRCRVWFSPDLLCFTGLQLLQKHRHPAGTEMISSELEYDYLNVNKYCGNHSFLQYLVEIIMHF